MAVTNIEEHQQYALGQAMEYGGAQQLHYLPQRVRDMVKDFIDGQHPLLTSNEDYKYHGVKTTERPRGSATLAEYIATANEANNVAAYWSEVQQYRTNMNAPVPVTNMETEETAE